MNTRQHLKTHARTMFFNNYRQSVGVLALLTIFIYALQGITSLFMSFQGLLSHDPYVIMLYSTIQNNYLWISILLSLFIGSVLSVCICKYGILLNCGVSEIKPSKAFSPFDRYGRVLGGSLWVTLWTFLWSLLFIVPGIVKSYEYYCAKFILADCPNVKALDAIELSKKMTYGYKAKLFVTDLSFLGWFILSALTFGILYIFYVGPYYTATMAGWYEEIKRSAISEGKVSASDFE